MQVTLLAYTPDPETTVACAAKLCYAAADIGTVRQGLTPEKTASFLDMLRDIGHESPIEHASFTFGVEGVSRSLLAQLTRHRLASYSVQSQRYVKESCFEFVTPPEIEALPQAKEEFLRAMEEDAKHYERLAALLQEKHYQALLAQGEGPASAKRKAEKRAIEDARFVLPNACATKLMCTMNARSLLNFFTHRCCNRAQWEIRALAMEMLRQAKGAAPHLFGTAGPPCLRGACPEGKMSCGQAAQVRESFSKL